jgi:hypothetical protein
MGTKYVELLEAFKVSPLVADLLDQHSLFNKESFSAFFYRA